jgi:hypothetical protein
MSLEVHMPSRVEVAAVEAQPDNAAAYELLERVLATMGCVLAAILISAAWVALALS